MDAKKNVLLITYYWPPSGGAGVHRWLRFSKYFHQNNVNLTVYCPENATWPVLDSELNNQIPENITVIRRRIFEPHKFLGKGNSKGVGFTQQKKANLLQRLIIWIRGNLFIPDSRVFWIRPSARFLSSYLKEHPEIDTIISTGPPHSMHLIASRLKKKHTFKWLADFRDPWTQIDFYQDLLPGKRADRKHKKLEKLVLTQADEVITVSRSCAEGLEEIAQRKIHVITNGYSFPDFNQKEVELDAKFTIAHFGSMPFARNPKVLWQALAELLEETPELKAVLEIQLIGSVDYQVIQSAEEIGIKKFISTVPPVDHGNSITLQRKAQLLLLVANNSGNVKGILTGKFFEYLGAKRPILAIGAEESDLQTAMDLTKAGCFVGFDDIQIAKEYLLNCFQKYQAKNLFNFAENLDQYSSERLAEEFIELI